jgi:hypothetical protein
MSLPLLIPNAPLLETLKETADVPDPRTVKAKRRAEWPPRVHQTEGEYRCDMPP